MRIPISQRKTAAATQSMNVEMDDSGELILDAFARFVRTSANTLGNGLDE